MQKLFGSSRVEIVCKLIDNGGIEGDSLCDLGSRDEILLNTLHRKIKYLGIDIYPSSPNTIYSNIEEEILTDEKFDIITALDVLEHTNDIQSAINNMLNICNKSFVINLPNELFVIYRLKLLFGKISGKFSINLDTEDRHRWFFTKQNVEKLISQTSIANHETSTFAFYRTSGLLGKITCIFSFFGLHSLGANSFIIIGKMK